MCVPYCTTLKYPTYNCLFYLYLFKSSLCDVTNGIKTSSRCTSKPPGRTSAALCCTKASDQDVNKRIILCITANTGLCTVLSRRRCASYYLTKIYRKYPSCLAFALCVFFSLNFINFFYYNQIFAIVRHHIYIYIWYILQIFLLFPLSLNGLVLLLYVAVGGFSLSVVAPRLCTIRTDHLGVDKHGTFDTSKHDPLGT